MATLPVTEELPDGYFVEESPHGILALHGDVSRTLHELGYGPESDGELSDSELAGRRPLLELRLDGQVFLVRRFSHGGLLRWLTGKRFLDAERPFRELILSDSLLRVGIRTPRVLAARARSIGLGWQLEVLTRRVDDSLDLGYVLGLARKGELTPAVRASILQALGDLVRRLHLHGCLHADLQPNNVLINSKALEGETPVLWVLDLDRSYFVEHLKDADRRANLRRLYRHVARREEQHGRALRRHDYLRFMRGYDPDGSRWKEDWRAVSSRHVLGLSLHRAGWLLERLLGGKRPDPRSHGDLVYPPSPPVD